MLKKRLYCNYCGSPITNKLIDGKYRDHCNICNTTYYENPLPVASCIVINHNREVLLVKRKNEPYKDMWCLPIGFAETNETIEEAALRELYEEAGITGDIVNIIDVDTINNYFYGDLAIITFEVNPHHLNARPGDDASECKFFPIDKIPALAWSSNEKAIQKYILNHKEIWEMIDWLKDIHSEIRTHYDLPEDISSKQEILQKIISKIIKDNFNDLVNIWIENLKSMNIIDEIPHLMDIHTSALSGITKWFSDEKLIKYFNDFIEIGIKLKQNNIRLINIYKAIALSRKTLWIKTLDENIFFTPIGIQTSLLINNKIIFFYDKITLFLLQGYTK